MNTKEVVDLLSEQRDMSKAETRRLLDTVVALFKRNLTAGKAFTIPGLGTFEVETRESRRSYNPHYETYVELPPKRKVTFRPAKALKEKTKHPGEGDE